MNSSLPKLLYLGFAFPPGVAGRFPEAQPAGHLMETNLITHLRPWFEIRSVGISWIDVEKVPGGDPSPGLPHALNLLDRAPELYHRYRSLARLRRAYRCWTAEGWVPTAIIFFNFSPVYNAFIRWLKRGPGTPRLIVRLADSMNLQRDYSWVRRVRHRFKPLTWSDREMAGYVDAAISSSRATEPFFVTRGIPWYWLPNGVDPQRAIRPVDTAAAAQGPVQFGYFGSVAEYTGLPKLLEIFRSKPRDAVLNVCGYGKGRTRIANLCARHPRIRIHLPRSPDECLRLASQWDVLVNPRPLLPGNENNFPSKVFEYALTGRCILSTRLSGVDQVLGPGAFYCDEAALAPTLGAALDHLSTLSRVELNRRGKKIQERLLAEFRWAQQAAQAAEFLHDVISGRPSLSHSQIVQPQVAAPV